MRIDDLPAPVTTSKADWIAASSWLGFTPTNGSISSRAQCESTIQRQLGGGYALEYITETAEQPNPGFADDPQYLQERAQHGLNRGRFLGVHRLRHTCRPLEQIIGGDEYLRIQDMWAKGQKRWRWSVAFPIVESFEIVGTPRASDVLDKDSYRRLYAHSSALLRPLNDSERAQIAALPIRQISAANAWIAIEDEMRAVEASQITSKSLKLMEQDLSLGALEGESEEQKAKIRRRAAWLADRFVRKRANDGTLICDLCSFDPSAVLNTEVIKARSALDVHHMHPLEEGVRYTSIADFALLCPTCHRMEHQLLRKEGTFFDRSKAPHLFSG